jgi:acetyl-CoA carboxylase carboxyl transferase subunit alpha
MAEILKKQLIKALTELEKMSPEERVEARINKYSSMGVYDTVPIVAEATETAADSGR